MYARVASVSLFGLHGIPVGVEADIQPGLPAFEIVGLPASAIREAKERVRSAILNSGYIWPRSRITVSLTPADFRKEGSGLDLPIAIAILASSEQIIPLPSSALLLGELTLDGTVRSFRGIYAAINYALDIKSPMVLIPDSIFDDDETFLNPAIYPVANLNHVISVLTDPQTVRKYPRRQAQQERPSANAPSSALQTPAKSFDDVKGQESAKRALEIAAAGNHHILLYGTPGAGKTMLAERFSSILPPLAPAEKTEVKKIYSVAGIPLYDPDLRPFRAPHHTISTSGMLGGGTVPRPGEVSLAHRGVLFLDEFPEFSRTAIEGLRQPLSTGEITISRSMYTYTFPSQFQLIAAMNPCPCGYYGSQDHACTCSPQNIEKYQKKISGPILDRIDLSIWVDSISWPLILEAAASTENTAEKTRRRVTAAKEYARNRRGDPLKDSEQMIIPLRTDVDEKTKHIFTKFAEAQHISLRGADKLTRLARTIADMEESSRIREDHLLEALQYRSLQTERSRVNSFS